ncbi:MAG: AraC family transcriptional regulator, partial [bacterium]|nr:AraC family transcriptional regulator [bacterium]
MASVPGSWILQLARLLDEKGVSSEPVLRRCAIDPDLLSQSESRVGMERFASLVTEALQVTGDSGLGLDYGLR